MKKFALIASNGAIAHITLPAVDDYYKHGESYSGNLAVELADGVDTQSMIQTKWYDRTEEDEADRWKEMTGRPSENYVFANGVWYFDKTKFETQVTLERNMRLGITDWTQLPDVPLTDSKKAEWATYRQSLRDFPPTIDDNITLMSQLVWPTKPS